MSGNCFLHFKMSVTITSSSLNPVLCGPVNCLAEDIKGFGDMRMKYHGIYFFGEVIAVCVLNSGELLVDDALKIYIYIIIIMKFQN